MSRVLLVEDSIDCHMIVKHALPETAELTIASDLASARHAVTAGEFDLILLDVDLPDGSGFGFCSSYLAQYSAGGRRPKILFLTGSDDIASKLTGYSVGADDYLVKPFHPLELKARILAQLRSLTEAAEAANSVRVGNLSMNLGTHFATIRTESGDMTIDLTPTEFKLLYHLARNEGRIQSRDQLLDDLFEGKVHVIDRTIDAHFSRIRKKLERCTHTIEAVYGIGYRLIVKDGRKEEA